MEEKEIFKTVNMSQLMHGKIKKLASEKGMTIPNVVAFLYWNYVENPKNQEIMEKLNVCIDRLEKQEKREKVTA